MALLLNLLVVLSSKVHLRVELDLPLLDETVVINDIIIRVVLVLELLVLGFVSVGNLVGWELLVLELEHHLVLDTHVLLLELDLPLLHKSVVVDNVVIWIVLVLEFLIFGLITVADLV